MSRANTETGNKTPVASCAGSANSEIAAALRKSIFHGSRWGKTAVLRCASVRHAVSRWLCQCSSYDQRKPTECSQTFFVVQRCSYSILVLSQRKNFALLMLYLRNDHNLIASLPPFLSAPRGISVIAGGAASGIFGDLCPVTMGPLVLWRMLVQ